MTRTDPHSPLQTTPRQKMTRLAARGLAGAAVFAAGYVSAVTGGLYATNINIGLLNAFDSVGKNLFGDAVFSASLPSQFVPGNPVRLDVATDSRISAALGVFIPGNPVAPNPCTRIAQLVVTPASLSTEAATVQLYYDQSAVTVFTSLPPNSVAPNVARCAAATTTTF